MTPTRLHQVDIWCDGTDAAPHARRVIAKFGLWQGDSQWSPMLSERQVKPRRAFSRRELDLGLDEPGPVFQSLVDDTLVSAVGGPRSGRRVGNQPGRTDTRGRVVLECRKCHRFTAVQWVNLTWALDALRKAGHGHVKLAELDAILGVKRRTGGD